jgi:hypothetical protein
MSPNDHLSSIALSAANALAHAVLSLPSFAGPDGEAYSLSLIAGPDNVGGNWMLVIDVGLPDGEKRIEFSMVNTGWGGFVPGCDVES